MRTEYVALAVFAAGGLLAQSAERPSFEVASVKPNETCVGDRQNEKFSPGRVSVTCIALRNLIQAAYGTFAAGPNANSKHLQILNTPEWMNSMRYDITAKARNDAPMEQMFGPMLQALLEDRFHLKVHRETRQLPVYELTRAKTGASLSPSTPGGCTPVDLKHADDPSPNFCGMKAKVDGWHVIDDARGMTIAEIAGRMLSNRLDRPVIDKTSLAGLFDAHLEFDRDRPPGEPGAVDDIARLSIFTAVQDQLGLKLSPAKGPVDVLVIEHVEKPDAN